MQKVQEGLPQRRPRVRGQVLLEPKRSSSSMECLLTRGVQRRVLPALRQPLCARRADAQGVAQRRGRGRPCRQQDDQGRAPEAEGYAHHLRCRGSTTQAGMSPVALAHSFTHAPTHSLHNTHPQKPSHSHTDSAEPSLPHVNRHTQHVGERGRNPIVLDMPCIGALAAMCNARVRRHHHHEYEYESTT